MDGRHKLCICQGGLETYILFRSGPHLPWCCFPHCLFCTPKTNRQFYKQNRTINHLSSRTKQLARLKLRGSQLVAWEISLLSPGKPVQPSLVASYLLSVKWSQMHQCSQTRDDQIIYPVWCDTSFIKNISLVFLHEKFRGWLATFERDRIYCSIELQQGFEPWLTLGWQQCTGFTALYYYISFNINIFKVSCQSGHNI